MAKTAKKVALYEDSIPDEIKAEFKKVMDTEACLMEYAAIKDDADKIAWVDKYGVGLLCVVRSVKVQTGYKPEPERILPKSTDPKYKWFFKEGKDYIKNGLPYVKSTLKGNVGHIANAFGWAGSPQGSTHWSDIATTKKPLDDESREFLETMVAIAENEGLV